MRGMQSLWVMVILLLDSLCIKYYAVKLAILNTMVQSQYILLYGKGLRDGRTHRINFGWFSRYEPWVYPEITQRMSDILS